MITVPGIIVLAENWFQLNCGIVLLWNKDLRVVGIKGILVDVIVEDFVFNVDTESTVDSVDCSDPTMKFVVAAIVVDWVDSVRPVVPSRDFVVSEGTVEFIDAVDFVVMGEGVLESVDTASLRR